MRLPPTNDAHLVTANASERPTQVALLQTLINAGRRPRSVGGNVPLGHVPLGHALL